MHIYCVSVWTIDENRKSELVRWQLTDKLVAEEIISTLEDDKIEKDARFARFCEECDNEQPRSK